MMSVPPVENLDEKMDGGVRLNDDVYLLLMEKYFGHASCAAVAQSGTLDGFSALYNTSRSSKGLIINEQSFYFTTSSWSSFIEQHITLESIKMLSLNNVYWLPGDLLESTILKMPNLEDLSIKGTQVCTVRQVAKILQSCQKIRKLDFTYTEKTLEEVTDGLKKENISLDSLTAGLQKLTSLKLATTLPDPQHENLQDPWLFIIRILMLCRDCTDLTVEVTYSGKPNSLSLLTSENCRASISQQIVKEWVPQLIWMRFLESVVLIKLGTHSTRGTRVHSVVLQTLLLILFDLKNARVTPPPPPLRRLWVQDFEVKRNGTLRHLSRDILQSYGFGDYDGSKENKQYESFLNMEHIGGTYAENFSLPLPSLEKLKYVSGTSIDDENFYQFCEAHPQLEVVCVQHGTIQSCLQPTPVNDAVCKLPKLQTFSCKRMISKEFVEAMTEAYPIIEDLRLTFDETTIPSDHTAILSAFRFPHLTSLSLCEFQLLDGAALIPIIKECPKLEVIHMKTDTLDPTSFPSNLELFLGSAEKLRDFRLEWTHKEDIYPATAFSILKSLLKASAKLERLVLIDDGPEKLPDWKLQLMQRLRQIDVPCEKLPDWQPPPEFADFLVDFTAKMTHMTCCCLTFNQMNTSLMKEIRERVENEVVTERPSLWFHLDRTIPEASDPGVPSIHYHQMVNPISFVMPRF